MAINCVRLGGGCEGALKKAIDELAQVPGLSIAFVLFADFIRCCTAWLDYG